MSLAIKMRAYSPFDEHKMRIDFSVEFVQRRSTKRKTCWLENGDKRRQRTCGRWMKFHGDDLIPSNECIFLFIWLYLIITTNGSLCSPLFSFRTLFLFFIRRFALVLPCISIVLKTIERNDFQLFLVQLFANILFFFLSLFRRCCRLQIVHILWNDTNVVLFCLCLSVCRNQWIISYQRRLHLQINSTQHCLPINNSRDQTFLVHSAGYSVLPSRVEQWTRLWLKQQTKRRNRNKVILGHWTKVLFSPDGSSPLWKMWAKQKRNNIRAALFARLRWMESH